jgi:DNA invertase Pin-like site-specific DNA recombinase
MRMKAAYLRVSTEDQNLSLQVELIKAQDPGVVYSDQESGSISSRKGYTELCYGISMGGISEVIVYRLDRLGRDPVELIRFFELLDRKHVEFRSLTEPWLSDWNKGPMQFLTWWLQIGMAKFELLLLKDRQRRGIDAAKARGKHLGRPRKMGITSNA